MGNSCWTKRQHVGDLYVNDQCGAVDDETKSQMQKQTRGRMKCQMLEHVKQGNTIMVTVAKEPININICGHPYFAGA